MCGVKILSSGSYLPKKVISNNDLESIFDTSDEWITQMTGIKERHVLSAEDDFLHCSYQAALVAINQAGIASQLIDLILVGTTTPYQLMPSTAVMLQQKLGINNCIAFDLQAACSGFMFALANAYYLMQSNPAINYALVMGCDALSRLVDKNDRTTGILFGDGFGAFLLGRTSPGRDKGIFYCDIGSDGSGKDHLQIPWGISQGMDGISTTAPYIKMNGKHVFKAAVARFTIEIEQALEETNLTIGDIRYLIPHQANIRIIQSVANALNISMESFLIGLDKHGNTSAASIPLTFDTAHNQAKINRGDLILLAGFGAGYTWGTIIFEF